MGQRRNWFIVLSVLMAVLIIGSCTSADPDGCSTAQSFEISPAGKNIIYRNWTIVVQPGAAQSSTTLTVKDCPALDIKHQTVVGARDKDTGETDVVTIPLK